MSVTLVKETCAGSGVSGANSMQTAAEAATAAENVKDATAFLAASVGVREQRLIDAWSYIEASVYWLGTTVSTDATRVCSFPRSGLKNRNGLTLLATQAPADVIKAQLLMAIAIHNYAIIEQGPSDVTSVTTTGVTVGLKTRDNVGSRKDAMPSAVYDLLRPYAKFRTDDASYLLSRKMWG